MPAVPQWSYPRQFDLTNPYNGTLSFNLQTDSGLYLIDHEGCEFALGVRETTDNVPQADGSIPHHRFLPGAKIALTIQLWERKGVDAAIACDELLAAMVDDITGAFRSLLNAGDNAGRLAWPVAGKAQRMLDDVRLLEYPVYKEAPLGGVGVVTVTIDSKYPYAQNLLPVRTSLEDGDTVVVVNDGTADYLPVFLVNMFDTAISPDPVSSFTIQNLTTGQQIVYDASRPGAGDIPGGSYGEINTFVNTMYQDGDSANEMAGIDILNSEFFPIQIGVNSIKIDGAPMDILWAPAYG